MIYQYLSQPSTWRGIIGLATASGVVITPAMATEIIAVGLALTGLVNVIRNERKG